MAASAPQSASLGAEIERLFEAARGGDQVAFGQLLETFRLLLLHLANEKLPGKLAAKAGASDLVQATFLEAQKGFLSFRGTSVAELKAWLCRMLENNVRNLVREFETGRRDVGREASIDDSEAPGDLKGTLTADTPTPSTLAAQNEEKERLFQSLSRLASDDRRVIELRHVDGASFPEIGKQLGISEEAARKRFKRAIERLQEEIDRGGGQ